MEICGVVWRTHILSLGPTCGRGQGRRGGVAPGDRHVVARATSTLPVTGVQKHAVSAWSWLFGGHLAALCSLWPLLHLVLTAPPHVG